MDQAMSRYSGLYAAIIPPRLTIVTLGPLLPKLRMGSATLGGASGAVSAEAVMREGPTARAAGMVRAVLRKFRREVEETWESIFGKVAGSKI